MSLRDSATRFRYPHIPAPSAQHAEGALFQEGAGPCSPMGF